MIIQNNLPRGLPGYPGLRDGSDTNLQLPESGQLPTSGRSFTDAAPVWNAPTCGPEPAG